MEQKYGVVVVAGLLLVGCGMLMCTGTWGEIIEEATHGGTEGALRASMEFTVAASGSYKTDDDGDDDVVKDGAAEDSESLPKRPKMSKRPSMEMGSFMR